MAEEYSNILRVVIKYMVQGRSHLMNAVKDVSMLRDRIQSSARSNLEHVKRYAEGTKNQYGVLYNYAKKGYGRGTKYVEQMRDAETGRFISAKRATAITMRNMATENEAAKALAAQKKKLADIEKERLKIQKAAEDRQSRTINFMKGLQNAMLGVGLSMLFTGMAIKRFTDTALMAIFNTYSMALGEQSEFAQKTNELRAAWEFFKFSLMDALVATGVFDYLLQKVLVLLNWFRGLNDEQKAFWGKLLIFGSIAGGLMMILGQTVLALLAPLAIMMFLMKAENVDKMAKAWTGVKDGIKGAVKYLQNLKNITFADMVNGVKKMAAAVWTAVVATWNWVVANAVLMLQLTGVALIAAAALFAIFKIWTSETMSVKDKILATLLVIALAIAAVALVFGGWVVALVAAIIAIILFVVIFWREVFAIFVGALEWIFAWTAQLILIFLLTFTTIAKNITSIMFDVFIWIAEKIDNLINGLIDKVNTVLPEKWQINLRSNLSDLVGQKKDAAMMMGDNMITALTDELARGQTKIKEAKDAMSGGVSGIGDKFKEWFGSADPQKAILDEAGITAPVTEMGTGDVDVPELTAQTAENTGAGLAEQQATNEKLDELININKGQLGELEKDKEKYDDLAITLSKGGDIDAIMRDFWVTNNGSPQSGGE